MKQKVLWISPFVPYDKVNHAGGKNHNFYIKFFKKSGLYDIELLTLCRREEISSIDLAIYDIPYSIEITDKNGFRILWRKILNIESKFNLFQRYGGGVRNNVVILLKKLIHKYYVKNMNEHPDIVILQWTQASLLLPYIKRIFPNSKYVCIEEDVCFQSTERKILAETSVIKKLFFKKRADKFKKCELNVLNRCDVVVTLNDKDTELLKDEGIKEDKIFTSVVYFDSFKCNRENKIRRDILFYGAMNRKENYLSAIWFIENVLPLLKNENINFTVVGGRPDKSLLEYQSEHVKIVGFVDDVTEYFENAACFVAPLVLGAGIKVKVLEALSAGVPVLTNSIGIEGIPARKGHDFIYCTTPGEYADNIKLLIEDNELAQSIGRNARQFIIKNYNLDERLEKLIQFIN